MKCSYVNPETGEKCGLDAKDGKPICYKHAPIAFIEKFCTHIKGRWAGVPFRLIPWQREFLEKAFGTLKPDGYRQYRTVYVEVPKKNGKSEAASGLALYLLVGDDEQGAEVYSAAGDRDQASLVYYPASHMVENNRVLKRRLRVIDSRRRIIDYNTNSFYQVLSAEAFTKHGLNPHGVIFDELHAQPNRSLYDVLTEGTNIARAQQMIVIITTAGIADRTQIGWEVHEYARQIKEGVIQDPTFLPIMYGVEDEDDWEDPEVWERVNPSLGYIFDIENIRTHYTEIKNNPARLNNFMRFRLNKWVRQEFRWMPIGAWDECKGDLAYANREERAKYLQRLDGRECYGGLDLSSNTDLTAFVLVFPFPDGSNHVVPFAWIPQDNMDDRVKRDRVPYDMWVRSGLIEATPGNVIDYQYIIRTIQKCAMRYDLREIAFDRWGATKIVQDLQAMGFEDPTDNKHASKHLIAFGQGFKSMSPPTKELQKLVLSKSIVHGAHPVLRWCADNLVVVQDPAENIKPDKGKSTERIDLMVALIMAIDRAVKGETKPSVYEDREMLVL